MSRVGAMSMRAEQDLLAAVPCRHCAQMLYGQVRFCPYCGAGEEVGTPADDAAGASFEAGFASFDRAEPPPAPLATKAGDMPKPAVQERAALPDTLGAFSENRDDLDFKIARIVPAAFERIEELPSTITMPAQTLEQGRGPKLKYLATGAALALCAFVLVLGYLRFGGPNEPDSAPALTAKLAQVQGALSRGDFAAAESELAVLAATYPDHPRVRALSGELDDRIQEQLARRERLREAALKASKAQGDPAPASASAPSHADVSPATTAQIIVPPAPETRAKSPGDKECNEALAALALCRKGEAR